MKKTAITELIEFIQNNHSLDTSEIYCKAIELRDTTERDMIIGIVNEHIHPDFRKLNNYRGLDYYQNTYGNGE